MLLVTSPLIKIFLQSSKGFQRSLIIREFNMSGDNDLQKMIKEKINTNKVMIFAKSGCSYCKEVKKLFTSLNIKFQALDIDREPNGDSIQDALLKLTGQRTVPNVFINGKHIGGCDDTKKLHRNGNLLLMYEGRA